jgi:hypothetical protein
MSIGADGSVLIKALLLQAGKSRVRDPMRLIIFSNLLTIPVGRGAGVYSASNKNRNQKQKNISGERARMVRKADNLTAIREPIV